MRRVLNECEMLVEQDISGWRSVVNALTILHYSSFVQDFLTSPLATCETGVETPSLLSLETFSSPVDTTKPGGSKVPF